MCVFCLCGERQSVEGGVGKAGLDAPELFDAVAATEDEEGHQVFGGIDDGAAFCVSHKDAGTPVPLVAFDVEPDGVEMPVAGGVVAVVAEEEYVAAQGAALVEAVVEERLCLDGDRAEDGLAEERVGQRSVEVMLGCRTFGVDDRLDGLGVDGGAEEDFLPFPAQLEVEFRDEAVASEEGAAGGGSVEESLTHVVELPDGGKDGLETEEVVFVADLRLTGVAVEGRSHVQGVGHRHDLMDDHGVPVLSCQEAATGDEEFCVALRPVVLPHEVEVGVAETQVVDGGVSRAGEVALDVGARFGAPYRRAVDAEAEARGDCQHVGLPAVVDVVAIAVEEDGLGIEEHHFLATAHDVAAVGIVVRVDEAVEIKREGRLGSEIG